MWVKGCHIFGILWISTKMVNPIQQIERTPYSEVPRLTWLFFCCCCWSLSWRIAWASPPVALPSPDGDLSMDNDRIRSTMAEEEAPLSPFLSLRRPRLARTHMGNIDVADILNRTLPANVTRVNRTNASDWFVSAWAAGTKHNHNSERPCETKMGGSYRV